jgi:hypothetical protein
MFACKTSRYMLLAIYPNNESEDTIRPLHTSHGAMVIAALLTIARLWQLPRCTYN